MSVLSHPVHIFFGVSGCISYLIKHRPHSPMDVYTVSTNLKNSLTTKPTVSLSSLIPKIKNKAKSYREIPL